MIRSFYPLVPAIAVVCGCSTAVVPQANDKYAKTAFADVAISDAEEAQIRSLVEQLVFVDGPASNVPIVDPGMKIFGADGKEVKPEGDAKEAEEQRRKFESCHMAFQKLADHKIAAFPVLVAHLEDKRQSVNFRNHSMGNSVGHACFWNIYYQLQDRPENYSEYGDSRIGRDGEYHSKPYWVGTPFGDAGGLKEWLEANKSLTYVEMQIKCLQWLLEKEKAIGACDAESYFVNILPLEIRILERRRQAGANVDGELAELRRVMAKKDVRAIPADLLPAR